MHGTKFGVPKIRGTILGGPKSTDQGILGSDLWKLPKTFHSGGYATVVFPVQNL